MKSWTIAEARAWLFGVLFLSAFLLVRVYSNTPVFFVCSPADDTGYLAYTESILKGHRFDWCDPAITDGNLRGNCAATLKAEGRAHAYNMYAPGPAITLLPITTLGYLLDRLGAFHPANVDPLIFWSIVGTFFLFAFGTFLLFECSLYWLKDIRRAWWMTIFFAVGNPVAYYVMRRPLMSHTAEYFLFFTEIYLSIRVLRSSRPLLPSFLLGLSAGLMMITRLNNIHIPALVGILLLFWPDEDWARQRVTKVLSYIAGTIPFLLFFLWINYLQKGTFLYSTQSYYEAYTMGFFLKLYAVNPLRVLLWFFGPHWGLIWLLPFSAYEFAYFFKIRRELWKLMSGRRLLPLALISVVLIVHLNMMANGPSAMSYAYRYIFTYYFLLHVAFLIAVSRFGIPLSDNTRTGFSRTIQAFLVVSMLISSAHILDYESRVPSLRPDILLARTEWIYHPFWRDTKIWTTPFFAWHSLAHMPITAPTALAASPLAALPILAIADTPLAHLPGMGKAIEYFRSKNRNVYSLRDLILTYEYMLAFGLAAAIASLTTRRWRTL